MSELLDQLSNDTLPPVVLEMFAHWCVWEQARPALVDVLRHANLRDIANNLAVSADLQSVSRQVRDANSHIRALRAEADPLGMSAAEAATFEFIRMIDVLDENNLDADEVAFFAARVGGWAGWARTDFLDVSRKLTAEYEARSAQELRLRQLIAQHGTTSAG